MHRRIKSVLCIVKQVQMGRRPNRITPDESELRRPDASYSGLGSMKPAMNVKIGARRPAINTLYQP